MPSASSLRDWLSSLHAADFLPEFQAQGFETLFDCVDCIVHESDLESSVNVSLLKTRRDIWQELCRQRRLRIEPSERQCASDLEKPLSAWLAHLRLAEYCARIEARGLYTTLKVVQHITAEAMITDELDIHQLRSRRTLWRAVSDLQPYCQRPDVVGPSPSQAAETTKSVSTTEKHADGNPHSALSLLAGKTADWAGWSRDGDLVQLLLQVVSCSASSNDPRPLSTLGANGRWRKLLDRLCDLLSRSSASASSESQPLKAETLSSAAGTAVVALRIHTPSESAAEASASIGASSLLSRACSVLYACASLVSVPVPPPSAAGTASGIAATAESTRVPAAYDPMASPGVAAEPSEIGSFRKLAELAAEVCHVQLRQAMTRRASTTSEDCAFDASVQPASCSTGDSPPSLGAQQVLGASTAAMTCNMLWSLGMLHQRIQPAITHPSLARECVACLAGSAEEQRRHSDATVRDRGDLLRQLCSYPTTAGKFISMALHGVSKLEPSCWVSGSEQQQQLKEKGHNLAALAALFAEVEALCAEIVDCSDTSSSKSNAGGSSHKRRRRQASERTVKMLELSARESAMLQEAKRICLRCIY